MGGKWHKLKFAFATSLFGAPELESFRRNIPFSFVQVEFFPFRLPQFAGTDEKEWGQFQSAQGDESPSVPIYCSQQRSDFRWIGDRRVMLFLESGKSAS